MMRRPRGIISVGRLGLWVRRGRGGGGRIGLLLLLGRGVLLGLRRLVGGIRARLRGRVHESEKC